MCLLLGMLVIGVIYGHKASKSKVVSSTEGRYPKNLEIIGVANPAHYIQNPVSCGQATQLLCRYRIVGTAKFTRVGPSGWDGHGFPIANFPFIRSLHGQNSAVYDFAVPFRDMRISAPGVDHVKLPGKDRTDLKSYWSWVRAPLIREVKIANFYFGTLRENQGIFGYLRLALHNDSLFPDGFNRAIKIDGLNGQYHGLKDAHEYKPSIECYEPPLYGDILVELFFVASILLGAHLIVDNYRWLGYLLTLLGISGIGILLATVLFGNPLIALDLGWRSLLGWQTNRAQTEAEECDKEASFHALSVTQKLLTIPYFCNTLIAIGRANMANVLSVDKQVAIVSALAEGSSIRAIERMTGVHRDTIMRLGVKVGKGCAGLLDSKMRALPCKQLQFDEIWGFIGKKERHVRPDDDPTMGDVWTFCAIDPETKIVPAFKCGKRDSATANAFVADVASRMANRVQISSDALRAYVDAIEMSFGSEVDFAQIIKTYTHDYSIAPEIKFSAPEVVTTEKKRVTGFPNMRLASTSHIERLNGTTRLHMRRLTRLTYAFSKKRENFEAATALHFAYYNFVKRHIALRCTPAMAAGIERDFLTVENLVEAAA